jgi:serine/threonine protein kinase/CheY-like chemotaxis protein
MHDTNVISLKPPGLPVHLGRVELGCFRLEQVIGEGPFGTTYLATQLGFDRQAVVKIAHADLLDLSDAEVRRRFADELRAATRVVHEGLVTLYTAGKTSEGLPAIAMELVPGDPLEDLLVAHPTGLPAELVAPIFSQLAAALAALHTAGVVHRGLSPRNVMVDMPAGQLPRIKVLDFGIAMLHGRPWHVEDARTSRRVIMAPEQVIGRAVPASDVFAMGTMLWWALTGQEYRSDALTLEDLQSLELEGHGRADPRTVVPDLPPAVASLVIDMLAYAERERPTAQEFLAAWPQAAAQLRARQLRRERRPPVPPPPVVRPAVVAPVSTRPRPLPSTQAPHPKPMRAVPSVGARDADTVQPRSHRASLDDPPTYDSLPISVSDPGSHAPAGPRVLVVNENPVIQHLLIGYLRRHGCRVHGTQDPRIATRSMADAYDLVVLSTAIADADPLDVARYLHEDHPEQWVVLVGAGTLDAERRTAGIREVVEVPDGLPRLAEVVDLLRGELAMRDAPSPIDHGAVDTSALEALRNEDPVVVQETIELFLGQTPDSLARIAEGHERRDAKAVMDECRTLSTSARALGAHHLARLAQAVAELAREGDLDHVPGFVSEMEREYGLVFRTLMDVHTATESAHGAVR